MSNKFKLQQLLFIAIAIILTVIVMLAIMKKINITPINIAGTTIVAICGMITAGFLYGWHPRFNKIERRFGEMERKQDDQTRKLSDKFKDVVLINEKILTKVDNFAQKQSLNVEMEDNIRECKLNLSDNDLETYLDRIGTILKNMFNEIQDQGFNKLTISGLKSKINNHYLSIKGAGKRLLPNGQDYYKFTKGNEVGCSVLIKDIMKLKGSETNNINNKFRRIATGFVNDYLEEATKCWRKYLKNS